MKDAPDVWSLTKPSARRSLILCAIGALVGLAIAGLGLFTAKGTRTSGVPAEDVALVNQVPILMSDYVQQVRALYDVPLSQATASQKRQVLGDMIREELFVQRGVELGTQSDTIEVRQALVGAVEAQTATDARVAQPSEADLRAFYRQHLAAFASEGLMTIADHRLSRDASSQTIATAVAALKSTVPGTPAADRLVPRSGVMSDGEEFYFAARRHLGDRLFAVARRLKDGEVSAPVMMSDGVHILVMQRNVDPVPSPFSEVRDKVLAAYVDAQTKQLTAANERFLRKRADVQVAAGYE